MEEIKESKKNKSNIKWYNNSNFIINFIIVILAIIIILSQSYAVKNNLSTESMFRNLLNHNSIFLLSLIYFVPLKMKFGKKYFNYLNIFLIIIYFIYSITSLLTLIQSFNLLSITSFCTNIVFLVYMVHTLLRQTRIWDEFKLKSSPFNDISNDNYFYTIVILEVILLAISLIEVTSIDSAIISVLTTCYGISLGRYIYLNFIADKNTKDVIHIIRKEAKDLPKFKTIKSEVSSMKTNTYQKIAIVIFFICFCMGIIFGNMFPSCSSNYNLYDSVCTDTEFNLSLTVIIWFISFIMCLLFYGIGEIIRLLTAINKSINSKK